VVRSAGVSVVVGAAVFGTGVEPARPPIPQAASFTKVHSLLPMKLNGIAAATASA
jgi:hypothetical protein